VKKFVLPTGNRFYVKASSWVSLTQHIMTAFALLNKEIQRNRVAKKYTLQ